LHDEQRHISDSVSFPEYSQPAQPVLSLDEAFAKIARALPGYEVRAAQLEMARAIHRGFAEKMPVVVEAGTGTGKSFAALVPAVLTGKRVVISTATIALQEQYLYKDIPLLQKALGIPFTAQLVKGRSHYLSRRRWDEYLLAQAAPSAFRTWAETSAEGDWSELKAQPAPELWDEVRSDGDDCLRERCPHFDNCFYFQSRRNLAQTQILVTNHALLLMDWATSRQLLPPYDFLVVDEAHQFAEYATRTLTLEFSSFGLRRTLKRIRKQFAQVEIARAEVEQIGPSKKSPGSQPQRERRLPEDRKESRRGRFADASRPLIGHPCWLSRTPASINESCSRMGELATNGNPADGNQSSIFERTLGPGSATAQLVLLGR
jgi:Rad3-related DNA helicase